MPEQTAKSNFILALLAAVALSVLMVLSFSPQQRRQSALAGKPAPPIMAAGWVNGTAPDAQDLAGRVVVVEAWATWCPPCRAHAPHLVKIHERFSDQDVVFIGLTNEDETALPQIEGFLDSVGITWLNGYGAWETLNALNAEYIPRTWVIGRDGKFTWDSADGGGSLDQAIEDALAGG